jgi:hypothetical protein
VVDTLRGYRAKRPRQEHVVQAADVPVEFLGRLSLRRAGVVSGLGRTPDGGTSP